MARKLEPPRLYLEERAGRDSTWCIIYKGQKKRLGLSNTPAGHTEAARQLSAFTAALTAQEQIGQKQAAKVSIRTVLSYYKQHAGSTVARPKALQATIDNLEAFFAPVYTDSLLSINGQKCRQYVKWRTSPGCTDAAARIDLSYLRAAIKLYHKEFTLDVEPQVTLPSAPEARADYLTRSQVAALIWAARKLTDRGGNRIGMHLARFLLIGVYTGTRSSAIFGLRWVPSVDSGWVDLEHGLLYRKGASKKSTKKRQPTVRLHKRLAAHMERWHRLDMSNGITHVISFQGKPVKSVVTSWKHAVRLAGLSEAWAGMLFNPVRHHTRHTAATWLMQAGVPEWEAAGYLGMSPEVLRTVYGHHCPTAQSQAASVGYGRNRKVS